MPPGQVLGPGTNSALGSSQPINQKQKNHMKQFCTIGGMTFVESCIRSGSIFELLLENDNYYKK